jgi:hypothetical protein
MLPDLLGRTKGALQCLLAEDHDGLPAAVGRSTDSRKMGPPVPIVSPFDGAIEPMPKLGSGEAHDPGVRGF